MFIPTNLQRELTDVFMILQHVFFNNVAKIVTFYCRHVSRQNFPFVEIKPN